MPIQPRLYSIPKMQPSSKPRGRRGPITDRKVSEKQVSECPDCGAACPLGDALCAECWDECYGDEYSDRQDETYDHPGDRFDG